MIAPAEKQWQRVEELAERLGVLAPDLAAAQVAELAAAGESRTVLTLLGTWLALPPPPSPLSRGSVVGERYTLQEKLGDGGMGSVWRAKQKLIEREVALKMIHPSLVTPSLQERFLDEIRILGQLNHPGIVLIFDAGVHEGTDHPPIPYFAMELVEGVALHHWARQAGVSRLAKLQVIMDVCEALQNAHDRGIVHRDLKPANILVRSDGQPVVLDFGIARLAGLAIGDDTGHFSGTPQYAAPEQHLGRDSDFRSGESVDVYSVGALLFEILSGRKLFEFPRGTSVLEMRRVVLNDPVPRLSEVMADCPEYLDETVARAVRREPADRFYTISALGRAVARVAELIDPGKPAPAPWVPAADSMVPGTNWRLASKLGEGGTGEVWLGVHSELGERRVFKFCDTEDKARTLKRELTLFRLLKERIGRNQHFIQIHDVSLDEAPWYLMMAYTSAKDLDSWWNENASPAAGIPDHLRLDIIIQTAEALQAAHETGILHRDIKPANLLVEPGKSTGQVNVLIADFGIGQIVTDELVRGGTRMGFTRTVTIRRGSAVSGTMLYLAPEVLEGNVATARSDVYSLGVVLWQLMIGNLHTALDPSDWAARIADPLLCEDLTRCLAGDPRKRWASAGELAASLRALPARRAEERRRQSEVAALERRAYRRGVLRSSLVAAAVVLVVGGLAVLAWFQRRDAERARGAIALEQAASLRQADLSFGRRARGMKLIETAAATASSDEHPALRSVAANVMGMADLVRVSTSAEPPQSATASALPIAPGETCRAVSGNGALTAIARSGDGLNGIVDLFDSISGERRLTIERKDFPWVPVAEAHTFRFSPDNTLLAVGGAATSRHLLLCNVKDGSVQSYLYHGSDLLALAWHPGGRLIATACADGSVRLWDIAAASRASRGTNSGNQFDLPPALDVPANDHPILALKGHRGPVRHVAFSGNGRWLASVDDAGYLRVHGGFSENGLPELPPVDRASVSLAGLGLSELPLAVELRLEGAESISSLSVVADRIRVFRGGKATDEFQVSTGELPAELHVAPGIVGAAWNAEGSEVCAITLTDIHWLHATPLEKYFVIPGKNPAGLAAPGAGGFWNIPRDDQYREFRPTLKEGKWTLDTGASFRLTEAVKGQGARTAIATAGDGRVAIYRGRRIHFFANHQAAPLEASLVADGGSGVFNDLLWDQTGNILSAVFAISGERRRVETWKTPAGSWPHCEAMPPATLECHRMVPANDGRTYIARAGNRGLIRFNPATQEQSALDASPSSRQDAPLAASPDGRFLALVVDRNIVRILNLPSGTIFADLHSPRPAGLILLAWDAAGHHLASVTEDGYLQAWNLTSWQEWISNHHLEN